MMKNHFSGLIGAQSFPLIIICKRHSSNKDDNIHKSESQQDKRTNLKFLDKKLHYLFAYFLQDTKWTHLHFTNLLLRIFAYTLLLLESIIKKK